MRYMSMGCRFVNNEGEGTDHGGIWSFCWSAWNTFLSSFTLQHSG
jgi:hypothetical protein